MMPPPPEPRKKMSFAEQWTLLKSFVAYYPRHKKLLFLDLSVVFLGPVLSTASPLIVYRTLQVYLPGRNLRMILAALSLLLFLTLLNIAGEYIRTRWGHTLGVRMEADMRRDMFAHIQRLSFSFFDRTKTGHLLSRVSNDLTMIAEVAHHCPEDVISATLMLIGGLFAMLWINPLLTLITLLPVPLILYWGISIEPKMRKCFGQSRKDIAEINSMVENSIQGVREVKSYTNEGYELNKFRAVNSRYRKTRESTFALLAKFHSGMMFFIQGWGILFLGIAALMIYFGKAGPAEVITFLMYSNHMTMPIMRLVGFVEQYLSGMSAFERFHEIMKELPAIRDRENALTALSEKMTGAIELRHVSFRYDGPECTGDVLQDISLSIKPGRTVALVGESGAGKTTLASLLPRFYEVTEGAVLIEGRDVRDYSQKLLRNNIGIVQQTPFLFDTTIRENILYGRPGASEEDLRNAARCANILDFIESLPDGFESMCGENGVRLSGGQKQRISLARVFLKDPPILIFDEATSALDNESEEMVRRAMTALAKNRTTVIIAHRLSTIKDADYIYCMKGGKIVEHGPHEELLARNGYYKQLYSMHSF